MYYWDKQKGLMYNDNKNESYSWHMAICLLEEYLTRANRAQKSKTQMAGNWNGTNLRRDPRRTGKESQVQNYRKIRRQKGWPIQSRWRSHKNVGHQRIIDQHRKPAPSASLFERWRTQRPHSHTLTHIGSMRPSFFAVLSNVSEKSFRFWKRGNQFWGIMIRLFLWHVPHPNKKNPRIHVFFLN